MMYITEIDSLNTGLVDYVAEREDGTVAQHWTGQELETAVWLVECDAVTLYTRQVGSLIVTCWTIAGQHDEPPFGVEYDEWMDARWQEVQDHQALVDDALERGI